MLKGHSKEEPQIQLPLVMSDTRLELHKNPIKEIIDHEKLMLEWKTGNFKKRPFPKLMNAQYLLAFGKHSMMAGWLYKRFGREVRHVSHKDELHGFLWSLFVSAPYSKGGSYHFYTMADLDRLILQNTLYWIDDFVAIQFEKWWKLFTDNSISCELFYDVPTTLRFQMPTMYEDKVLAVIKYVSAAAVQKWTKAHFTDDGQIIVKPRRTLLKSEKDSHKSSAKNFKKCTKRLTKK